MNMEQIELSETSAYDIQTPGNYPEESIQHSDAGELPRRKHTIFSTQSHCLFHATQIYDTCVVAAVRDRHGYPLILFETMDTITVSSRSGHGQISGSGKVNRCL